MSKKRFTKTGSVRVLTNSNFVRITEEVNGQLFFEVGSEITTDIAEAVAIMLRIQNIDESIWSKELPIKIEDVEPRRALY